MQPNSELNQEHEDTPQPVLTESNQEPTCQPVNLVGTTNTKESDTPKPSAVQVGATGGATGKRRIWDTTLIPLLLMAFWVFGYAFPRAIINGAWGSEWGAGADVVGIIWGTLIYAFMTPLSIVVVALLGNWFWRKHSSVTSAAMLKSPTPREPLYSPLASRRRRLGAPLLDGLAVFAIMLPGSFAAWTQQGNLNAPIWDMVISILSTPLWPSTVATSYPIYKMVVSAVSTVGILSLFVYQVYILSTRGQTIGKRILKIRIVRYANGTNPGFVRVVLLRLILPVIICFILGLIPILGGFLSLAFWLADVLFIFGKERRCIHDFIAGTKVVAAEKAKS